MYLDQVSSTAMDQAWAEGWRHFGREFFRDSLAFMDGKVCRVTPLRLLLSEWLPSKSERRILKKNKGFMTFWHPSKIEAAERALFQTHKSRFKENVPEGLENFLGWNIEDYPCRSMQCSVISVTEGERKLVACSYLDIGEVAVSSIYGMFDPRYSQYGLGIYTMLMEMLYAKKKGFRYYYSGYATIESSAYDYKKRFHPQEIYQWGSRWESLSKQSRPPS